MRLGLRRCLCFHSLLLNMTTPVVMLFLDMAAPVVTHIRALSHAPSKCPPQVH